MRAPVLGEAATHLPWLSPCAETLVALARAPTSATWEQVRIDPGGALLVLRQTANRSTASPVRSFPALLLDPSVLEGALWHLQHSGTAFVDWNLPATRPIYHASLTCARLAAHLAERTGRCDPDQAWVSGLLAPLGWLAVCAADPGQAAACLADAEHSRSPVGTQQRYWGYDQASISRRLTRSWQLPAWLSGIIGHLGLTAETVHQLGADSGLFLVTQLAVSLAQAQGIDLRLGVPAPEQIAALLALSEGDEEALRAEACTLAEQVPNCPPGQPPHSVPLLADILTLAVENRRLHGVPLLDQLASDLDRLHQALEEQRASEASRLRVLQLSALAEFAAGAGHEINNPLAVISGQAQYLLSHLQTAAGNGQSEYDQTTPAPPEFATVNLQSEIAARSLQTIINQTQRIHQMLNELMQFARPARPQNQPVAVLNLIHEVAASLSELAAQRRVQLLCPEPAHAVSVHGDHRQLGIALTCLLRNAIEAAPPEGWAGIRLEMPGPDRIDLVVEDNGSGPPRARREHLFDPFFSGREAGRGRGLGLPTAWRLAREHGGDVYLDDKARDLTRFVLTLPCIPLPVADTPLSIVRASSSATETDPAPANAETPGTVLSANGQPAAGDASYRPQENGFHTPDA